RSILRMSELQRSVTGWLDRALQRLVPSRLPRAPLGFPSPLRGGVRGGGDEHKASLAGPLLAFESLRSPVWSPRDYAAFAREGFMQNAIVYRSVRMVAEAAASVPLLLYEGDQEIGEHPLLDLIARPNPVSSAPDLLESWYGFLLVSGNAYLEAVAIGNVARAARAAPRPHENHPRPRRLARGLRVHRRRQHRPLHRRGNARR